MASSIEILSAQLKVPQKSIEAVLQLLSEGSTIPFIARYRKEMTGSLDEEQIKAIETQYKYQENLKERKEDVIRLIEEKQLMTPALKKQIEDCTKLSEVEDLYRPFKEKKHTKATAAIEAGLEPLSQQILAYKGKGGWDEILKEWTAKTGKSKEELREMSGYILAQNFSDDVSLRQYAKRMLLRHGSFTAKKKKDAEDEKGQFEIYYDFSSPVSKLKPHQIMALHRGEKNKILSTAIEIDQEMLLMVLRDKYITNKTPLINEYLYACLQDAWKRLIFPSLSREISREIFETAQDKSIDTFKDNLEHLLMTRPIHQARVLGFDPAYRTGCKLAVLDEQGSLLDIAVIYPHPPAGKTKEAEKILKDLIQKYHIQYISIGNGTASRESEKFVADVLKDLPDVQYALVSEAGASVYSASDLAREEFPDLTVEKRSAISIGRRIQDPLSELVKIDPKSIGVGEYQHDVNQKQLAEALDFTTEKVVNRVGVNVNTASPAILKHVSGLNKTSIKKIIDYRNQKPIASREEIASIKGISDKTYEQCIGFMRVSNSSNPLDNTGIHPESYPVTHQILESLHLDLKDLQSLSFRKTIQKANVKKLASQFHIDHYTVQDILKELSDPGLDPRDSLDGPVLKSDILKIEDLKIGMELSGTVRNVTSFGAFVDIGLHSDGLIHISKLSNRFVSNPNEIVHTGQIVNCYVVGVDIPKERVQLSLVAPK